MLGLALLAPSLRAAQPPSSLNVVPTITNLTVINGQLVASGLATATIRGRVFTAPFANVPVNLSLAQNQSNAVAGCPVLNLALGPINLDLLGLVVQTSPICLDISANPAGGLLGELLCNIGTLLNQGLSLNQILGLLGVSDVNTLLTSITQILNGALGQILNSVLTAVNNGAAPGQCAILSLTLGPLNLNLLGLVVNLDNCAGGPVTVTVTANHGGLLGNLLCSLTNQGLTLGTLLGDILGALGGPL
jgi:hypothetical protein